MSHCAEIAARTQNPAATPNVTWNAASRLECTLEMTTVKTDTPIAVALCRAALKIAAPDPVSTGEIVENIDVCSAIWVPLLQAPARKRSPRTIQRLTPEPTNKNEQSITAKLTWLTTVIRRGPMRG